MSESPVVVVGAGPAGLSAAAHLVERGEQVLVLEAGDRAGAAVSQWHHVRRFSRWSELVDPAAERLLDAAGWVRPDGDTDRWGPVHYGQLNGLLTADVAQALETAETRAEADPADLAPPYEALPGIVKKG